MKKKLDKYIKQLPPKIIFSFPDLDPNSKDMIKIKQLIQEWWNNEKNRIAITTGEMKVFRIKKGELYEIVEIEKKVKNPFWKRLVEALHK